ncbi:MAG TPA: phosphopantetheine-binding protein [bacterium]
MKKGSEDEELKSRLKALIIRECRLDIAPESIPEDLALIGPGSTLELDSLDTLQLVVALKKDYGVQINDRKEAMRVMKSLNALADVIQPGAPVT